MQCLLQWIMSGLVDHHLLLFLRRPHQQQQQQHLTCCGDARTCYNSCCNACTCSRSETSEENKNNALVIDFLGAASHATASSASFILGSTTAHTKVNVTTGVAPIDVPPVWPCFGKCSPAVPCGPTHGENVKRLLSIARRRQGVSPVHSQLY